MTIKYVLCGKRGGCGSWGGTARADDGVMRCEDGSDDSGGLAVIDPTHVCVILMDATVACRLRTFPGTSRTCVRTLYKLIAKPRQPATATVTRSCIDKDCIQPPVLDGILD